MRVVELHEEMELGGKEVKDVINFDQLVRIFVDTDVDTHFIVSLSRTSTVAELRELVKATHRHCYPDSGDVDVGKLAVPGGDYGYHLADFLLIGQVYDGYEGKVFAEVKNHDPASNSSQGLSRMQALSFKTSSTQKKVPLLAPQPFENVAGQISTNAFGSVPLLDPRGAVGEPRALVPVELNPFEPQIELLVPKLQKEEIDEDGNCYLLSQEPLDGFPSKVRGLAVGSFERIVEEEDEKLEERPSTAVNDGGVGVSGADLVPKLDHLNPDMYLADFHMKTSKISVGAIHALSSDIQGVSRKRVASESNERPSKLRRLAEQTPSGNTSKAPLENGRNVSGNGVIELSEDDSSNLDGMNNVVKDVNAAASLSHMNRAGDLDANYLSFSRSKRQKKKALQICGLTISENRSEAENDAILGVEDKEEMCSDEVRRKERQGGSHLVTGSELEGSGNNGLEVGREAKSSLPEDVGVPPSFGQKGKKKRKPKEEKVPERKKTQKRKEKEGIQKPVKETEQGKESQREEEPEQEKGKKQKKGKQKQEKESEREEEPEQEKESEREEEPEQEKGKKQKKGKLKQERELEQEREKQERELEQEREKQERELEQEREKQERELEQEREKQERELEQERKKQKKELKKEREKQEQEKHERELEQEKREKKEKQEQEKQERELEQEKREKKEKQEQEKQERELEQEKREKKEKHEKNENKQKKVKKQKQKKGKKQKQIIDEITTLDCASLNPLVEESDKEPEQENVHLGAAAVSPNVSQHIDNDEKESDDVPDVKKNKVKKRVSTAAAAVAYDVRSRMGDEDSGRSSALDFVKDEISESGTPQREPQVSRGTSGEYMIQDGAVAIGLENIDDKVLLPKTSLFGDGNDVETSPSYQGGTETSPEKQGTKVGSVKSQETPSPSKPLSYPRAGRGVPSQTRSIASSRDVTKSKQIGGTDKTNESQSSQCSEKATQQSEGINLGSEVTGAWFRRSRSESEAGHVDQSQVTKPGEVARSRSSTGESSAESNPRFADQTEVRSYQDVSRKEDDILEALHTNHASRTVKSSEKHANTSAKRTDGEVNIKNDSLEFFSQDQSFHVAPTQVEKALSGSSTEDNSDESDTDSDEVTDSDEDIDKLKREATGNLNITQQGAGESKESSDESGDLARPGSRGFPSVTTRTPVPSGSRMTGNGGSQSFKRRASGVAAEIEAKFAQFIESQGGLDEIMGITLGQRRRSLPVESSTQVGLGAHSTGSMATPFGSPLDLALNTQESVKNSPMALDIAQEFQNSAGKFLTPQFKVPKPVPVGTISGFQGVFNSAAATVPLAGKEVPKAKTPKELRLKRKELTPQVDEKTETRSLLVKHNNDNPFPALESSKETFLGDKDAAKGKPKSVGNSSPSLRPETLKVTFLDDLNAAEKRKSSVEKSSAKTKRSEEEHQDSQFMVVNNTDHILEQDRRDKKLGSKGETKGSSGLNEDGSLVSPKSGDDSMEGEVKKEIVETDVFGSPDMFVPGTSRKKRRKESEKEGSRKKRMKFLPEELDGKEVTILPENSVERSARETDELYVKLEKANRELWLKSNSVSSFRKEAEKIGNRNYPAADLDDTEGAEGEDVAQSRLVGRETEIDDVGIHNSKVVGDAPVDEGEGDPADRDPNPELCAGTTEASDREDSVFQSQDEKAETSQPDVFDYVSGDELPTKVLSKSNEKKKSKRMEELSGRAVQRVLEDEMLHVVDTDDVPVKKSRKSASPVNWTVRMRGLSPTAIAPLPSSAAEFGSSPNIMPELGGGASGEGGAQVKPRKVTKSTPVRAPKPVVPGPGTTGEACPMGCGKVYSKKTSAYYLHRAKCPGAPPPV